MKHKMNDEDEFDLLESSEQLDYSLSSITHNKFEFNLDEEIKKPSYYRNLIEVLNNATEQDLVVLNINSGGGNLDSAISIIDALRNTRANTLARISGSAYSAAGIIALSCQNLEVGEFVWTGGDCHIYQNHREQVELQLTRSLYELPTLTLNPDIKDIFAFTFDDISVEGYESHPAIKAKVAV